MANETSEGMTRRRSRIGAGLRIGPRRAPRAVPGTGEWMVDEGIRLIEAAEDVESGVVMRAGEHLMKGFFADDVEAAELQRPRRFAEYWETLKKRMVKETGWNEMKLRRVLWAQVVAHGLPEGMAEKIKWTHLAMLHQVQDRRIRLELAAKLAAKTLKGRRADEAIQDATEATRGGGPLRGRPAVVLRRAIERAQKAFDAAIQAHVFDAASLGTIRTTEREELKGMWKKFVAEGSKRMAKL
jgi:hypothetical protein